MPGRDYRAYEAPDDQIIRPNDDDVEVGRRMELAGSVEQLSLQGDCRLRRDLWKLAGRLRQDWDRSCPAASTLYVTGAAAMEGA